MHLYWVILSRESIKGEEHYSYDGMFYTRKEKVELTALSHNILMDGKPVKCVRRRNGIEKYPPKDRN